MPSKKPAQAVKVLENADPRTVENALPPASPHPVDMQAVPGTQITRANGAWNWWCHHGDGRSYAIASADRGEVEKKRANHLKIAHGITE